MGTLFSTVKTKTVNKVVEIQLSDIVPNPNQPRRFFDEDELKNLALSIRNDGLIQPITVRKVKEKFELISGERRFRAACMAGVESIPAIVINSSERNSALLALVENIQRSDLSFFDEAFAISNLIELYGMTQEDAAIRLGMAQSTIANKLRLLKLNDADRAEIVRGHLTERHARAFLKLSDPQQRLIAIQKVIKYNMNVEKTEFLIEQLLKTEEERESFEKRAVLLRDVKLFVNTINKAVETIKMAGVKADATKTENDEYIEYHIKIPVHND